MRRCGATRTGGWITAVFMAAALVAWGSTVQASVVIGPVVAVKTQIVTTTDSGTNWTVQPAAVTNSYITRSTGSVSESRYVFEFPSLGISGPVHVNSAIFRFDIRQINNSSGNPMTINFYGYGDANGTVTTADALKTTSLVASLPDVGKFSASLYNITVDPGFVESVINSGGRVGLVGMAAVGDSAAVTPLILTISAPESFADGYPALTVEYTVPEPATLSLLVLVGLIARKRRSSQP